MLKFSKFCTKLLQISVWIHPFAHPFIHLFVSEFKNTLHYEREYVLCNYALSLKLLNCNIPYLHLKAIEELSLLCLSDFNIHIVNLWGTAPCNLLGGHHCVGGTYCFHHHGTGEDGGSMFSRNVLTHLPDYVLFFTRKITAWIFTDVKTSKLILIRFGK
jgi:hypothetical protein